MTFPASPPVGWKIRQIPWLEPGSGVTFTGQDLTLDHEITTQMTVGATLGGGGQAAVFSVSLPEQLPGSWSHDDVVLRVSYQDDEYGRDPRRTSIYQRLADIRGEDPMDDPLEGLLRLHAVGHLPPPAYLPSQDLWAQVLDRGGASLQHWISGNQRHGLGPEYGVAVMLPILQSLTLCHGQGIVHRDIKPGNVFVTDRCPNPAPAALNGPRARRLFAAGLPFLRLGDLGSMTYLSADAMARLEAGTAPEASVVEVGPDGPGELDAMTHMFTTNIQSGPFTPPEVWNSAVQSEANPAGDVWQLAVTLFFTCTGELPFQGWRSSEWRTERPKYVAATQEGEPNSPIFDDLPDRLQYLLRWCLTPDPVDRPDLASLTEELDAIAQSALPPIPAPAVVKPAVMPEVEQGQEPAADPAPVEVPDATDEGNVETSLRSGNDPAVEADLAELDALAETGPASTLEDADWSAPSTSAFSTSRSPANSQPQPDRRRLWLALAAAAAVVMLVVVAVLNRHDPQPSRDATATPSASPSTSVIPPLGVRGELDWHDNGGTLSAVLPQLFSDNPLANRPVLGMLKESLYQFCDPCVNAGLRLRVDVATPPKIELTANGTPQPQPIGPYLVLMTPLGQKLPSNPLGADRIRTYPIAARYASSKFGQVVLVPINRIGEGNGATAGDRTWQTQVSDGRTTQRLTFDIPGQVTFITILWFNDEGVVGFNRFDTAHHKPDISN